jgi:hypothetical protein
MRLLLTLVGIAATAPLAATPSAPAQTATAAAQPAPVAPTSGPSGEITVTATPAPKPGDNRDPNRVICKGDVETGSLVRKKKRCMTRAQWAQEGRDTRANFNDAQRRDLIRQQLELPKPGPGG